MDPRDSTTPSSHPTNGSDAWLSSLLLNSLHKLLSEVGELRANQKANRRDIIDRLEIHQEFHTRQMGDFKLEVLNRLDSQELSIRELQAARVPPAADSSLVRSLFGSIGEWVIEKVPWKYVAAATPGILLAIFGHAMPDSVRASLGDWIGRLAKLGGGP